MMMRWVGAVCIAVAMFPAALASQSRDAASQETIMVISEAARNEFPVGVTFSISFSSPALEDQVRLRYELAPDGTGASGIAECSGTGTISCVFTLQSGRGIFVIPGAEITYHWEIADQQGNALSTPEKLYVHEDTRFNFRTISEGNVTVYFHAGTEAESAGVLAAAVETLASVGALERTQVAFPVKLFLYENADQMQPAIVPIGGRGVQVSGEVWYSDTAMVAADGAVLDITRHEIAHIVTREATKGPFGIALWMNEGISVYSQRQPFSGHEGALQAAIRNDRVLSMAELNSSATRGVASTVGLYYGQSGAIVKFLVDEYGAEQFALLLKTFKEGATPDDAFGQVYALDALGIENAWRASVGLDANEAPSTPQPTADAGAEPTPRSGDISSDRSSDDGGSAPAMTIVLIVLLAAAIIGAGGLAVKVARERL